MFLRLGSSVAQLSVVPVRWTHSQEVSHLDTHTAPGVIQKVDKRCVCNKDIAEVCQTEHLFIPDSDGYDDYSMYGNIYFFSLFLSLSTCSPLHSSLSLAGCGSA